jgi:hypothetical protein
MKSLLDKMNDKGAENKGLVVSHADFANLH